MTNRACAAAQPNGSGFGVSVRRYIKLSSTRVVLCLILFVGLLVRSQALGARSYWFDEGFCWKMISFSWREMLERIQEDTNGPLYYILLKSWSLIWSDSPLALRSFSVLMGELAVLGMYFFAREAASWGVRETLPHGDGGSKPVSVGLATAALVAISAYQVEWASEVRMYALGAALAAISSWLLLRSLRDPGRYHLGWVAYGIIALMFAYTHNYALFTLAAQFLFAIGCALFSRRLSKTVALSGARLTSVLLVFCLIFAGWSPWWSVLREQSLRVSESFWLPEMSQELFATTCYQMFASYRHAIPSQEMQWAAVSLFFLGFSALLWRPAVADGYVFLAGGLPFLLGAVFSLYHTRIFYIYYFVFAQLFLLAGLVVLIFRISLTGFRRFVLAALVANFLLVYVDYGIMRRQQSMLPGAQGAAAFLDQKRKPHDLVIVASPMLTPILEGHSRNRSGWRTYETRWGYPHYQGTAVVRAGEFITDGELEALKESSFWTVGIKNWDKGSYQVPVPGKWVLSEEWQYPEIHGTDCRIIVRKYRLLANIAFHRDAKSAVGNSKSGIFVHGKAVKGGIYGSD